VGEETVTGQLESEIESEEAVNRKAKPQAQLKFRLTSRDIDLLGFLLDQKFASLEQLYFRFFDVRDSVTTLLPNNLYTTRQRLQKLRHLGLISTERVFSESKSLYLLTYLGYQIFQGKRPDDAYSRPMRQVDFRSFGHDTKVNDCRIAIERQGVVMKWISERRVRMKGFSSQFSESKLPKEIVPDGIFVSTKGKRVAFEIETTKRERRRYKEKKEAFLSVMRGQEPLIHLVIWVGATEQIYRDLRLTTEGEKVFSVESYSHFLSKLWPKGVPEKIGGGR
jgi:hypothetical protein